MKNTNQLGIWMDDSIAYLMGLQQNPFDVMILLISIDKMAANLKKTESSSTKKSVLNKYYIIKLLVVL
jgi:hypothetical protein